MINKPARLLGSILLCLLTGFLGSFATFQNIPTWYATLNQPSFTPPDWIFGPVWTALYIMMGVALYLVSLKKGPEARRAVIFFIAHLAVNAAWSFVFFGFHQIGAALAVIVLLWVMIAVSMGLFWKLDKRAAYLLLPYLAWVSFATVLNATFFSLN